MPSLAIVIPFFKIDFFEETIVSLKNQTHQQFHIHIGNDASGNDPMPIVEKHLKSEQYSYYDYETNKGGQNPALQWERILENVTEDYFMILGDDDYVSNNLVEEFYNHWAEIEKLNISVVKFSQQNVTSERLPMNDFTVGPKLCRPADYLESVVVEQKRSSLSEYIFKRLAYQKIGFVHLPLAWGTDNLAVFMFAENSPLLFINNAKVFVRMSNTNISGKKDLSDKKAFALQQFHKYIINNLHDAITTKTLKKLFREQVYLWKYKNVSLEFNVLKTFCKTLDFKTLALYLSHLPKKV